jgi:hypothetical protein
MKKFSETETWADGQGISKEQQAAHLAALIAKADAEYAADGDGGAAEEARLRIKFAKIEPEPQPADPERDRLLAYIRKHSGEFNFKASHYVRLPDLEDLEGDDFSWPLDPKTCLWIDDYIQKHDGKYPERIPVYFPEYSNA